MQQLQFIGTTPNALIDLIDNKVKERLNELKESFEPKAPTEFLTRKETAALLKINLSTLYLWTRDNKLQSYGISGKVYYKRSELESTLIEL
ncbi:helix-turn-helix domain-containing protein [Aurantibacter crassamenti]|uniref:helix-turn-helix domain-containing protein n=1 Tax=Aurantibacter crassamenti TaxID=1837375 RepID=UPI00193AA34E|nr:helix-turn-helix domain-containing protein [Aurantibacter crassamenti]MBM1106039.1 helix-turn-helix domain-containing protein [Aurantibacter crassamenti]